MITLSREQYQQIHEALSTALYALNTVEVAFSPCEAAGYKPGDKFVVTAAPALLPLGTVVRLHTDDGTYWPLFEVLKDNGSATEGDMHYSYLDELTRVKDIRNEVPE
jgi:hypothetical protein